MVVEELPCAPQMPPAWLKMEYVEMEKSEVDERANQRRVKYERVSFDLVSREADGYNFPRDNCSPHRGQSLARMLGSMRRSTPYHDLLHQGQWA